MTTTITKEEHLALSEKELSLLKDALEKAQAKQHALGLCKAIEQELTKKISLNLFHYSAYSQVMAEEVEKEISVKAFAFFTPIQELTLGMKEFHLYPGGMDENGNVIIRCCLGYGTVLSGELYFRVSGIKVSYDTYDAGYDGDGYYCGIQTHTTYTKVNEIKVFQ